MRGHLEEGTVRAVPQSKTQRGRTDAYRLRLDQVEKVRDVRGIETELRPRQNGAVFGQDSIIDEQPHLPGQKEVYDSAW